MNFKTDPKFRIEIVKINAQAKKSAGEYFLLNQPHAIDLAVCDQIMKEFEMLFNRATGNLQTTSFHYIQTHTKSRIK